MGLEPHDFYVANVLASIARPGLQREDADQGTPRLTMRDHERPGQPAPTGTQVARRAVGNGLDPPFQEWTTRSPVQHSSCLAVQTPLDPAQGDQRVPDAILERRVATNAPEQQPKRGPSGSYGVLGGGQAPTCRRRPTSSRHAQCSTTMPSTTRQMCM